MAVDDNNPNVNFGTFSALSGIPTITGTVVDPPVMGGGSDPASAPFTHTNVDPPAAIPTSGGAPGEMNGQGGVVSTPTPFSGGSSPAPAAGGIPTTAPMGALGASSGKPSAGSFSGGDLGTPPSGGSGSVGGGAKVGADGGGTSTSGFGQFFEDGGAVQDDDSDDGAPPGLTSPVPNNIEDRRGPLDDNDQPMSATNANATTPKYEGAGAQAGLGMGGKLATSNGNDWVSSALNMVDQAVQWGRQQYFGSGQRRGMPAADPAQGFANGGAVKAYEDGGPVEEDDDTQPQDPGDQGAPDPGTEPSPQPQQPQPQQQGYGMHTLGGNPVVPPKIDVMGMLKSGVNAYRDAAQDPNDPAHGAGDKIKAYLLGLMPDGSSVDPQQAAAAEQQTGHQDPGDAALAAIGQQQDPASGWQLIQHNRRQHGLYQAFAQAALDQGHIPAAAKAATQMMDNVPDGLHYDFTPGPHGVIASLSKAGGGPVVATKPMNTFQFQKFLKNPTMFDQALDNGGYSLLNQTAQQPQKAQDQAPDAPDATAGGKSSQPEKPSNRQVNLATKPIGTSGDHTLPNAREGEEDMDPQLLRRANSLFPSVGQAQQRAAWVDKMVQQGTANTQAQSKIDTGVMGKQITADAKLEGDKAKAAAGTTNAQIGADAKRDVQLSKNVGYNQAWAQRANAQLAGVMAKVNQQGMAEHEKTQANTLRALLTAQSNGSDVSEALKQMGPVMQRFGIQAPVAAPQPQPQQQQQPQQQSGMVTIGGKQMTREQAKQLYDQQFGGQQ